MNQFRLQRHHTRGASGGPLEGVAKALNPARRPLDLSSSPPWVPAGPAHQAQWAGHRRQRKNSVGYTFTDLAEIVCRNIKDDNDEDEVVASVTRCAHPL